MAACGMPPLAGTAPLDGSPRPFPLPRARALLLEGAPEGRSSEAADVSPGGDSGDEGGDGGEAGGAGASSLSLVGEGLTAVPPGLATRFPALRRLNLHGNAIAVVAGLDGLAALQELHLSCNCLAALPDGAFSGLHRLTSLSLASNSLAELSPAALAGLPSLRSVNLAHNSLTCLAWLAALHGGPLQRLDLRNNCLASLAELSVLAGLPRLTELQLAGGGTPGAQVGWDGEAG